MSSHRCGFSWTGAPPDVVVDVAAAAVAISHQHRCAAPGGHQAQRRPHRCSCGATHNPDRRREGDHR